MNTASFIGVVAIALVVYAFALRRMHMGSEFLPHTVNSRDHIHHSYQHSYVHNVLHMLHLENDDGVGASPSVPEYFPVGEPHSAELLDAIQAVDAALLGNEGQVHGEDEGSDLNAQSRLTAENDPHGHGLEDIYEKQQVHYVKDDDLEAHLEAPDHPHSDDSHQSIIAEVAQDQLRSSPPPPEAIFQAFDPKLAASGWMSGEARSQPAARQSGNPIPASPQSSPRIAAAVDLNEQTKLRPPPMASTANASPRVAQALHANVSPLQQPKSPRHDGLPCGQFGAWKHGRCACNRLRTGPHCERHVDLAGFKVLRKVQEDFKGAITMSKQGLAGKRVLRVFLPGKESDPDKGNRVLGRVTSGLLNAVEERDIFHGKIFDSCAVVGSSGILHHFDFGKEIDQHDMVLRFNSAPTHGFERLVGSKTTHRITNTQNWVFRESDSEHIMVHMRSTSSLTAVIRTHMGDKKVKLAPFDTDFVHYMANSLPFMATSGLYGIIIALHRCAEVDLYGFQVSNQHGAKYHYYNVCDQPANAERDGAEWLVVKAIVQSGLARFREPCVIECHESKAECERCKTSSQLKKVTNFGRAERTRCPRCSTQYGGCRPQQHWAFRRRFVPPRGHS